MGMQPVSQISARAARACVLVSAALALAGCASAPVNAPVNPSAPRVASDTRPSSATLTAEDFDRVPDASNALEAVRRLRPLFLRPRPGGFTVRNQAPVIAVYINDMYAGNADVLLTVPPNTIETMRYLQRTEAMTFAGSQTRGDGFIMIRLKGFDRRGTR